MESILQLNKVLTEYKRALSGSPDNNISFDHMIVLYCLSNKIDKTSLISRKISKDKAYVSRLLKSMVERGLVKKLEASYDITHAGRGLYIAMYEIHLDFFKVNSSDFSIIQNFSSENK